MFSGPPPGLRPVLSEYMGAVQAFQSKQWRKSADQYLLAFRKLGKRAPWAHYILDGYTSLLTEEHTYPTDSDLATLRTVSRDKNRPLVVRTQAAFALGLSLWLRGDRDGAAEAYRKCVFMHESARAADKSFKLNSLPLGAPATAAAQLAANENLVRQNLAVLEGRGGLKSPGARDARRLSPGVPVNVRPFEEEGGRACDACRLERGQRKLKQCARCELAWYCDPECQRAAWRRGHKRVCHVGVAVGDTVVLGKLQSRPELNGKRGIVQEATEQEGRWAVELCDGGSRQISIAEKNLKRVRVAGMQPGMAVAD